MFEKLRMVFSIPELRQKIFLTLFLLAVYRIGYHVRLPVLDSSMALSGEFKNFMDKVAVFSATDLRTLTIFGLGLAPYISASIIFQLLGTVWKPIEDLRKEGAAGRKKINEYTRYLTVILCVLQSWVYLSFTVNAADNNPVSSQFFAENSSKLALGWQITAVAVMTAGSMFLMWLGEQIDEYGIGNGISLLIMAGILAQMPRALWDLRQSVTTSLSGDTNSSIGPDVLVVLAGLFIAVVFGVVFITMAQRRIQMQSAKHVRGRRVFGGTKQFLPLKINQSGVMPIIFASSFLLIPGMLFGALATNFAGSEGFLGALSSFSQQMAAMFNSGSSFMYNLLYVLLIFFFCFFWTSIMFNPKEISQNLQDSGAFIPGYRPGKRTADYLEKVMVRITYVGAAFLAVIAIVPSIISSQFGVSYSVSAFYGGTGLLIAVSVAFDLIQKIDSHLLMRNYKGLLES
ncbi:MAG: preprotein translocase subunit SecY [Planctomycetota bacterium]|jgi:preprotein translocase subunit SecY